MAENKNVVEDEIYDDDIVILLDENGEEVEFIEVAEIELGDKFYSILQPVKLFEGMQEDEAFVFEVTEGDEESDNFSVVTDDEIIDAVFAEYERLVNEAENENKA